MILSLSNVFTVLNLILNVKRLYFHDLTIFRITEIDLIQTKKVSIP